MYEVLDVVICISEIARTCLGFGVIVGGIRVACYGSHINKCYEGAALIAAGTLLIGGGCF